VLASSTPAVASAAEAGYPAELTLREARERYFARSGFDASGYSDRWVKLPVGPFALYMPNLAARQRCIAIHDIDHVVTGYGTDWHGELSIAAFEVGMGCGRYWFGWMINTQGLVLGALLYPHDMLRAYVRGRRCRASLYALAGVDDAVLDRTVGELREELGLDACAASPRLADGLLFAGWVIGSAAVHVGPIVALVWGVAQLLG
jgi:hypothetical protein